MHRKKQRGEVLRTNLLARAEKATVASAVARLLARCIAAWREPTWRGKKLLQKRMNIMAYRFATARAKNKLLAVVLGAWADSPGMEANSLKTLLEASHSGTRPIVEAQPLGDGRNGKEEPARPSDQSPTARQGCLSLPPLIFRAPPGLSCWQ